MKLTHADPHKHPGFAAYHKDCGHVLAVAPDRRDLARVITRGEEHGVYGRRIRVAKDGDLEAVRQSTVCGTCVPPALAVTA
jgi:hypothetical protein